MIFPKLFKLFYGCVVLAIHCIASLYLMLMLCLGKFECAVAGILSAVIGWVVGYDAAVSAITGRGWFEGIGVCSTRSVLLDQGYYWVVV